MEDREDWYDMKLPDELRRYVEAVRRMGLEERQTMLRFAPVLCRCTRWYDYRDPHAPQETCVVHTSVAFNMKGDWL